jgi:tetratricopeptide (TPR) repeat protein
MTGEKIKHIKSMYHVEYANYLYDKKDVQIAINHFRQAINLNTNNYYAYCGLTASLMAKRLFQEALDSCNRSLSIKPDARLFVLQSVIYSALGNSKLAEESCQNTFKYFHDKLDVAYGEVAYGCYQFGLLDAAENYMNKAMAVNPSEAGIHYNLANIYLKKQQNEMAKAEFRKVLELSSIDRKKERQYKEYARKQIENL